MSLNPSLPHGSALVTVGLVALVALYALNKLSSAMESAHDAVTAGNEAILHERASFERQLKGRDALIARNDRAIASLKLKIYAQRVILDSALTPNDSITALTGLLYATDKVCALTDSSLMTCKEENGLLKQRNAVLEDGLSKQIKASQCHILFLGCPSRIKIAELFTVLGLGAGYYLGKQ